MSVIDLATFALLVVLAARLGLVRWPTLEALGPLYAAKGRALA